MHKYLCNEKRVVFAILITLMTILNYSCSPFVSDRKTDKSELRSVAQSLKEGSCFQPEYQKWFDNGRYSVEFLPLKSGVWSNPIPQSIAAYNEKFQFKGSTKSDQWTSEFAKNNLKPTSRSEFFSRGTFYYFKVENMDELFQSADQNFRLMNAQIVGANSILKIYRIDQNKVAKDLEECPKLSDEDLVHTIPYFSLRTSGNRTNQMPKSSFKVKVLNGEKWKSAYEKQLNDYQGVLQQAPKEIYNLTLSWNQFLENNKQILLNEKQLAVFLYGSTEEFKQVLSELGLNSDDQIEFKLGQMRNGLLWWKNQLQFAVQQFSKYIFQENLDKLKNEKVSYNILSQYYKKFGLNAAKLSTQESIVARLNVDPGLKKQKLFDMESFNLKAMWNDPSQMREALAWYMFEKGGVVAPKHTYAKLCFGQTYRGLFSLVEQIDESFVEDRKLTEEKKSDQVNLYKVYMGTEDVGLSIDQLKKTFEKINIQSIEDGDKQKNKIIDAFVDNPFRGENELKHSAFAQIEPFKTWLLEKKFYFDNLGGGTLNKLDKVSVNQKSAYYKAEDIESRTYQLQTDWKDASASQATSYLDLEKLINIINSGNYESDSYYNQMNEVLDTKAVLRWAAMTMLLGGWDNYYMNPQNFYLLNTIPFSKKGEYKNKIKFVVLPWDYDQSFSMSFGERAAVWWNTSILDWESMRLEKRPDRAKLSNDEKLKYQELVQRPLITNMLKNPKFKSYYLLYMEWMIYHYFNPENINQLIGQDIQLTDNVLAQWKKQYSDQLIDQRQKDFEIRLRREVWDDPSTNLTNFRAKYEERLISEISDSKRYQNTWLKGKYNISTLEKHLGHYDFQNEYQSRLISSSKSSGVNSTKCDQESFVEPRKEKEIGQCQESDNSQEYIYPMAWKTDSALESKKINGLWSLIAMPAYMEHMGLAKPRWDIMSRTGRQYKNSMVYENGYLGRRMVWKELWQETKEKCNPQYKIFEGIEHHVRERVRTALEQMETEMKTNSQSNYNFSVRKQAREMNLEQILNYNP